MWVINKEKNDSKASITTSAALRKEKMNSKVTVSAAGRAEIISFKFEFYAPDCPMVPLV